MSTPQEIYHSLKLEAVKKALEGNFFQASVHDSLEGAEEYLIKTIVPAGPYASVGFGGSATVGASGLLPKLRAVPGLTVIDRNDASQPPERRAELTRETMLVELYVASVNALTLDGQLVNIDKFGNRVAAIAYGPKKVALFVGRNKIVPDIHAALARAIAPAAAMNSIRLGLETPCAKTGKCHDCRGASRICGVTSITQRSFPEGRIHVLLINQDLGF
ncbi:MAG: lactate utilization protein [Deltaproteobacteria bacterium]|jgi:hypothetical protein|nr:lactate utilization protein [Deltaproteobacteria bacterium]